MANPRSAEIVYLADFRPRVAPALSLPDAPDAGTGARRRLAIWIGVSLLLHALALALPWSRVTPPERPVALATLKVVLVTGPPAAAEPAAADQPAAKAPVPPPAPKARALPEPVAKTRPRESTAPARPAPRDTAASRATVEASTAALGPARTPARAAAPAPAALPEPNRSSPPASPSPDAGRSAPAPAATGVATAPSAATPVAASDPPLVPPSFSADYLDNPPPAYPLSARRLGQSGLVLLRVLVSESGKPVEVRIARTAGVDALDRAALEAVRGWTFVPARRGEAPVAAWVEVPLRFRLDAPR